MAGFAEAEVNRLKPRVVPYRLILRQVTWVEPQHWRARPEVACLQASSVSSNCRDETAAIAATSGQLIGLMVSLMLLWQLAEWQSVDLSAPNTAPDTAALDTKLRKGCN